MATKPRTKVADLEEQRTERLARALAAHLEAHGELVTALDDPALDGDPERWRRAARRAGRVLSRPVRTGVNARGRTDLLWIVLDDWTDPDPNGGEETARAVHELLFETRTELRAVSDDAPAERDAIRSRVYRRVLRRQL